MFYVLYVDDRQSAAAGVAGCLFASKCLFSSVEGLLQLVWQPCPSSSSEECLLSK